jgi:hypothetical protein
MHWLLLAISVFFVLAAAAIADPDVPLNTAKAPASAPEAAKQAVPSADNKPKFRMSAAEVREKSDTYFKQCINDWDAATHMTKKEWQRTCRRITDERVKFMVEQMGK